MAAVPGTKWGAGAGLENRDFRAISLQSDPLTDCIPCNPHPFDKPELNCLK